MQTNSTVTLSVDIKNIDRRKGTEVLQMYIRDNYSSVARPVKELKSFKKIWLDPGQSQTVSIEINPELLPFYDKDIKWILEPGDFTIIVGGSSDKTENIKLTVLK